MQVRNITNVWSVIKPLLGTAMLLHIWERTPVRNMNVNSVAKLMQASTILQYMSELTQVRNRTSVWFVVKTLYQKKSAIDTWESTPERSGHTYVKFARKHFWVKVTWKNTCIFIRKRKVINVTSVTDHSHIKTVLITTCALILETDHTHVQHVRNHSYRNPILTDTAVSTQVRNHTSVQLVRNHSRINPV